jgi:DNA-directed RNA polymerase subunit RPC12/RpoP
MEGVHFFPPNRPDNRMHQVCTECGHIFESRPDAEGAEIVCDSCYQGQFEPMRVSHWQRVPARLRSARRAR